MRRNGFAPLQLLLLASRVAFSQEVFFDVKVSTPGVMLGERATLAIAARYPEPATLELDLAASATDLYHIAPVSSRPPVKAGAEHNQVFQIQVLPLAVGKIEISLKWLLRGGERGGANKIEALASPSVTLDVLEPPLAEGGQIRDIKPPRAARPALWPWILFFLALAGAYAAYRKWRRPAAAAAAAAARDDRPPHVRAQAELEALVSSGLWRDKHFIEFYTRLTDILRRYVEGRFGIPAPQLTTWEIARHLREAEIDRSAARVFKEILDRADLVKFAKTVPEAEQGPQDLEACRALVSQTAPPSVEPAPVGTP